MMLWRQNAGSTWNKACNRCCGLADRHIHWMSHWWSLFHWLGRWGSCTTLVLFAAYINDNGSEKAILSYTTNTFFNTEWQILWLMRKTGHVNTDLVPVEQMHCGYPGFAHFSVHYQYFINHCSIVYRDLQRGLSQIHKDTPQCGILRRSHGQQSPGCCSDKI